jgi:hypothetical protein
MFIYQNSAFFHFQPLPSINPPAVGLLHNGQVVVRHPFFNKLRADIYFIGICSIDPTIGVTTMNCEESEVKKQLWKCRNE